MSRGFKIFLLLLALGFLMFHLADRMATIRRRPRRPSCGSNLKQLGLGIMMWRSDHTNAFPRDWAEISRYIAHQPKLLVCPSSGHQPGDIATASQWSDFSLVTNPAPLFPSEAVLACCSPENHQGEGACVLFLDGHVEWLNSQEWGKILSKQQPAMKWGSNKPFQDSVVPPHPER